MLNYRLYFLFFLLLSADITFAQCSMCRAVLNSSEAQETAKGVNNGILFLMSLPYLLLVLMLIARPRGLFGTRDI